MTLTFLVNIFLLFIGFLFRVLLYSYRVIFDPKKVVNTSITKNSFNKWYFVSHLYLTAFGSTFGLYACIQNNNWLAFWLLDIMIWISSLGMMFIGVDHITTTYGSKVALFTILRNISEILIHSVIAYLTHYDVIETYYWLRFIVFGLWSHRLIDTYPKFYIFRKHESFNLAHMILTYITTVGYGLFYESMIAKIILDIVTIVYIIVLVGFIRYYQWNNDHWRDLGPLMMIFRIMERSRLRSSNIHRVPKNLDERLMHEYKEEKTQYKKWNIDNNKFRTVTGYGTDRYDKLSGASGQYIGKNVVAKNVKDRYTFQMSEKDMMDKNKLFNPNLAQISYELFTRDDSDNGYYQKTEKTKQTQINQGEHIPNTIFAYWTQLMTDDWVRIRVYDNETRDSVKSKSHRIPVTKIGEYKNITNVMANEVTEPFVKDDIEYYPNDISHWWNSGIIYGCTLDRYREIRDPPCHRNGHKKGLIKIDEKYLALDSRGQEITGVTVNINSARGALHYTFAKFHNIVAHMLEKQYPDMDDEHIRQTCRLIVSACIAKIHTLEWTTALLNDPPSEFTQYFLIDGILGESVIRMLTGGSRFQDKPRFNNNSITGILGGTTDRSTSFAHTIEFQSAYKLHHLIPSKIHITTSIGQKIDLGVMEQSFLNSPNIFVKAGVKMHDFIHGMGTTIAGTLNPFNVPSEMMKIPIIFKTAPVYDNVYMNILAATFLRDRMRGVYRYNAIRKGFGLSTFTNVDDWIEDCKTFKNPYIIDYELQIRDVLKRQYNNDMEMIDFMVGCALEKKYPGCQIPDTMYTIFTCQTQRRLEQDPFFTDKFNKDYYTEFGMRLLDDITMARVLKIVYPELIAEFADDDNVFMVWGKNNKKVAKPSFFDTFYQTS